MYLYVCIGMGSSGHALPSCVPIGICIGMGSSGRVLAFTCSYNCVCISMGSSRHALPSHIPICMLVWDPPDVRLPSYMYVLVWDPPDILYLHVHLYVCVGMGSSRRALAFTCTCMHVLVWDPPDVRLYLHVYL